VVTNIKAERLRHEQQPSETDHDFFRFAQVCIPTHDSQRFYSTNDLCALGQGTSSSGGSGTAAAPSPSDGRYSSFRGT